MPSLYTRALVILALLSPALGCSQSRATASAPTGDEAVSTKRAIGTVLDDWHDAAAKADEARYFGHLDDDSMFLGTDASERWDKRAFLAYSHPHFEKGKAWTFRSTRRDVVLDSEVLAHFDEDLETKGLGPARGSGVLMKRNGRWRILQYNLTITVPNERFDVVKEGAATAALLKSPAAELGEVGFMTGSWIGTDDDGARVEEHWTHVAGGALLATSRTVKDGKVEFFEFLRIERRADGSIVYIAQPLGKPPTEFKRVESPKGEAVFENPAHDWPKRIRYRREENKLHIRVDGSEGQPVSTFVLGPALVERSR
jgi:hypothetical protein